MTPAECFAIALDQSRRLRAFTYSGLRARHPAATDDELDRMYAELILPPELFRRYCDAFHRR